jgi:hypothetical protein
MRMRGCKGIYVPTLLGLSPRRLRTLSSEEFLARLQQTPLHTLAVEQINAIDADERLNPITNAFLLRLIEE